MLRLDFRTLRADEIDVRIGQQNKGGVSLLLYKDARCDMQLLDETVGAMNWKREHKRENANCVVSVWDDGKQEWVSKEDTGTESNTEALKGLASDSFKRACVNWGIGRELYTSPRIFVKSENLRLKDNPKNPEKPLVQNTFFVASIEYDENKVIKSLDVHKAYFGKDEGSVFKFGDMSPDKRQETAGNVSPDRRQDAGTKCADCGAVIESVSFENGSTIPAATLITQTKSAYGRCLCYRCAMVEKNKRKAG